MIFTPLRKVFCTVGLLFRNSLFACAVLIAVVLGFYTNLYGDGPTFPNQSYSDDALFQPLSLIDSPGGHGTVAIVGGYLMTIFSSDGNGTSEDGGIDFWDISEPTSPVLAARIENEDTHLLAESHSVGFSCDRNSDVYGHRCGERDSDLGCDKPAYTQLCFIS